MVQAVDLLDRLDTKNAKKGRIRKNSLLNSLFSGNLGRPRAPSPTPPYRLVDHVDMTDFRHPTAPALGRLWRSDRPVPPAGLARCHRSLNPPHWRHAAKFSPSEQGRPRLPGRRIVLYFPRLLSVDEPGREVQLSLGRGTDRRRANVLGHGSAAAHGKQSGTKADSSRHRVRQ